jgi:two-component system, NarL family, invasion response regulator UvrY
MNNCPNLVLIDDHSLLRGALARMIRFDLGYPVLGEFNNGRELKEWLTPNNEPDIVMMDISMPELDGYDTTLWLKRNFPLVKVIALSMSDDETSVIRMVKNGARGYILKDVSPSELKAAIDAVMKQGFYYSELVTGSLVHSVNGDDDDADGNEIKKVLKLKTKDIDFLKLVCTEMTYKEVADKMLLSPRTIDGYREELFQRLGVKSRVGLVLFAIKNGIVHF